MSYSIRGTEEEVKPQYSGAVIGLVAFIGVFALYKYLDKKLMSESGKIDIHKKRKRSFITTVALP